MKYLINESNGKTPSIMDKRKNYDGSETRTQEKQKTDKLKQPINSNMQFFNYKFSIFIINY